VKQGTGQKKAARTVHCPCREASDATYKTFITSWGALLETQLVPTYILSDAAGRSEETLLLHIFSLFMCKLSINVFLID
jgi:hypothetical protein